MLFFSTLLFKILPLYFIILMGYIAGKHFSANRDTVAHILFFMVTPLIIFFGVINIRLNFNILMVPFVTFAMGSLLSIGFYRVSRLIWKDSTKNLVGMSAGTGNTGFFGLPIALLLFDTQGVGIYIMAQLGLTLYENIVGFYLLAKGIYPVKECFYRLAKQPSLYAFALGLAASLLHISVPGAFDEFVMYTKGTYTLLGMMVIGLSLAQMTKYKIDFKYIGMTFLAKFVAWPLLAVIVIGLDAYFLGAFNQTVYDVILLISIVPIGVSTVILASLFKNESEKAATAVLVSIVFALIYIPIMANWLIEASLPNAEIADNF